MILKKGSSFQIDVIVVSESTMEFEEKNNEYECQSHNSGAKVKLVSVTEIDTVVEPHDSNEAELQKDLSRYLVWRKLVMF